MTTPHHNKKQKVCKDIIAYPEEKTNKKHQIPPHKRKGSSRKKPYSPYIHVVTLCCPPSAFPAPPERCWLFCPGRAHWFACGCIFFAGFPGRFPPPSAAPLICFVAYFRVRSRPLCGSRLFPFLASFFVRFYFPVRPSYLLLSSGLMLRSSFPSDFLFLHFYFIAFFYFHFLYKKGAGQNKIK